MISETVQRHYLARWGRPSRHGRFIGPLGHEVEIFKWSANANPEGVALYATNGASLEPMDAGHRVEFVVGLFPEEDEIARSLALLAAYPSVEKTQVDHGHTVSFSEPLWPGTDMRTFLLLRQRYVFHEIIPPLKLPNGTHVEFLKAIPIFSSELEFKRTHGLEELLDRWERAKVPFWNPNRQSASLTK